MNARESVSHEQATEMLPWLVNDSLNADEKEGVLEHARSCVICRRDTEELERLRDSIADAKASIPAPDMRKINARIDALIDRRNWGRRLTAHAHRIFCSPWRIAFVAQSVLIVVLASFLLWPGADNGEFTTLTEPGYLPSGTNIRVVFSPELDGPDLTAFLNRFELAVVNGPSSRGVYTLGLADSMSLEDRDKLLMLLQGDPGLLFVQPVSGGEGK